MKTRKTDNRREPVQWELIVLSLALLAMAFALMAAPHKGRAAEPQGFDVQTPYGYVDACGVTFHDQGGPRPQPVTMRPCVLFGSGFE